MSKKPQPGYLQQVIKKALARELTPGVQHVVVEHQAECPLLKGSGNCTCSPEVTFVESAGRSVQ